MRERADQYSYFGASIVGFPISEDPVDDMKNARALPRGLLKLRMMMAGLVILVAGCATPSTGEIRSTAPVARWVTTAPIEETFRVYKDFAEEELSGGDVLWAEGIRTKAYFYGEAAEISLVMESGAPGKGTYMHLELRQHPVGTHVTTWIAYNSWNKHVERIRQLLPTQDLSM
ncbi:hypothetical protein EIM48_13760 [Pseudoxanthomonas sp. SGNA-20]|nr:hypothetical protein EIM48_13760 [Pseudoxanthomonas sp. SGNA-20]